MIASYNLISIGVQVDLGRLRVVMLHNLCPHDHPRRTMEQKDVLAAQLSVLLSAACQP